MSDLLLLMNSIVPKPGFHWKKFRGQISGFHLNSSWSLCVGAGISMPLFPPWNQLVGRFFNRIEGQDLGEAKRTECLKKISSSFGPDALIEAARLKMDLDTRKFAECLAEEMYLNFWKEVTPRKELAAMALCARTPSDISKGKWNGFLKLMRDYDEKLESAKNNGCLTALGIAEAVNDAIDSKKFPSAILTFNAEPLLYTLINAIAVERHKLSRPKEKARSAVLDRVTRAVSPTSPNRIPYVFCHGLLPVPGGSDKFNIDSDLEKLVFSEGQYLALTNTSFAWQSAAFLKAAFSGHIIFVGVSFSDPNMRRWLSWVQDLRDSEMQHANQTRRVGAELPHYWLRVRPDCTIEQAWIEAAVSHLGVRLVWLDSWRDVAKCLKSALD